MTAKYVVNKKNEHPSRITSLSLAGAERPF